MSLTEKLDTSNSSAASCPTEEKIGPRALPVKEAMHVTFVPSAVVAHCPAPDCSLMKRSTEVGEQVTPKLGAAS